MCPEAHKESNRLRAPVEIEVEVEKKTILRKPTLGETLEGTLRLAGGIPVVRSAYAWRTPTAVGIPEKENFGVSQKTPFSHPCGFFFFGLPYLVG